MAVNKPTVPRLEEREKRNGRHGVRPFAGQHDGEDVLIRPVEG